ncbi:MAG TPA: hypothetical protein VM511_03155 [Luteolibacter sp.]|nr:hypothetical protein [Luteolibacter sp.]
MRFLMTWLLVFGVFAGLGMRVLAIEEIHHVCSHEQHDCQGGHPHDGHQHDDDGPLDHHHHCGACLHGIPLGLDDNLIARLSVPGFSRYEIRHDSERTPDGPFQALDKPPLI